jgi:hypothetical protein
MQPICPTESQMNAVLAAAMPLPPDLRSSFVEACARKIAALPEVGDGALHRIVMQVQKIYFDPPDLSRARPGK